MGPRLQPTADWCNGVSPDLPGGRLYHAKVRPTRTFASLRICYAHSLGLYNVWTWKGRQGKGQVEVSL